jgi:UDP-glucuronate 4-epimerase
MMAVKLADNLMFGRAAPLYNEGQLWRDWTYVDDIVAGVVTAADRPLGYEIINLGRGEPVRLADFIHRLEKLAGKKARLAPAPLPDTDIVSTHADISKARQLLHYRPTTAIDDGVTRFWDWYKQIVNNLKKAA